MKIINLNNGHSCAFPDSNRTIFINVDNRKGRSLNISSCECRPTHRGFNDLKEITIDELMNLLSERDKTLNGR